MKNLLYFSISLITIFSSFSQCPTISYNTIYFDVSNENDTLTIYSFEDPEFIAFSFGSPPQTTTVFDIIDEIGNKTTSAQTENGNNETISLGYYSYGRDLDMYNSISETSSLRLIFNFIDFDEQQNIIGQYQCSNSFNILREYSILDSLSLNEGLDTFLICIDYSEENLSLNYLGKEFGNGKNSIHSIINNNDSLLLFYINGQNKGNELDIEQLNNNDIVQVLRLKSNEVIEQIYSYSIYDSPHPYKSEFKQVRDTVWSNIITIKKTSNPTANILTLVDGTTNLCPGDFAKVQKDSLELQDNYRWKQGGEYISNYDTSLSLDKTELTSKSSGVISFIQTGGYNNQAQCPFTSNSINIVELDNCAEGVVEGFVIDKSNYPYSPLEGVLIESDNGYFGISDSTGKYKITFPTTDTIKQVFITNEQFSYASTNVIFDSNFLYSGNNDLQSYFIQNKDLSITISSERNRPGFTIPYTITVLNKGKTDTTTNLIFDFDSQLTFINIDSLTPNPIILNNKLKWNDITLTSGTTKRFKFYLKLDSTAILSSSLINTGNLDIQDDIIENNSYSYSPVIVGSYDPNDKHSTVLEAEDAVTLSIEGDFEYLIRFQNTGTDTAFTVRVTDSLDIDLDLRSLRMIDASHNYKMSFSNRTITWLFNEIKLVDSTANEPASHGFIRFKISQSVNNSIGTELRNKASIFFDYNLPIVTNEVVNIVGESLNSPVSGFNNTLESNITIHPNPSDKQLIIKGDFEDKQVFIYSISGVHITPEFINENTINLESIKSGIYIISIGEISYKFIKQ